MREFLASRWVVRIATALSATILVVGVAAFVATRPDPSPATNTEGLPANPDTLFDEPEKPKLAAVPRAARRVAGEFIVAAAGREDLEKAWRLTDPELKQGIRYKEWLTGNIPVAYYPAGAIGKATFAVQELTSTEIFLNVLVLPKESAKVKSQAFAIGLRAKGSGPGKSWLVHYWAPIAVIPVPALPDE